MSSRFVKYQGLGNDFILIDNTNTSQLLYSSEQAVKLCNRNFGVGADGVIFALPGENGCDYTMRIFNSDGSEPQMCGNGIRCMAKFLQEIEKKFNVETNYSIWTGAGVIQPTVTADGSIIVDMGEPILQPERIPTNLPATIDGKVVEAEISALGKTFKTTVVSMGNPHSVSIAAHRYMLI
jgi:diaminopimelate epimerase